MLLGTGIARLTLFNCTQKQQYDGGSLCPYKDIRYTDCPALHYCIDFTPHRQNKKPESYYEAVFIMEEEDKVRT